LANKQLSVDSIETSPAKGFSGKTPLSVFTGQIFIYIPALLIPGVINVIALAFYTRLLSSEAYGRYALVLAVVITTKMLAFEWLRLGLFRFFQKMHRNGNSYALISTTLVVFVVICSLVSVFWVLCINLIPVEERLKDNLWVGLPLLLVWALFDQILQINRASIEPIRYGLLSAIRAVLCFTGAIAFLVFSDQGEKGLILGLIFGISITISVDLHRWIKRMALHLIEWKLIADLLRYGLPLTVSLGLGLVISISDRFLLQYYMDSQAVGVYSASYDLANQTVVIVFTILNLAVYPLVLKALEHEGIKSAQEHLRRYSIILFAVTIPVVVCLALIAKPISTVLLGVSFRQDALNLIPLVAISTFFMGARTFYADLAFQIGMRTDLQIWCVAAGALLNVVLNLCWIPVYGLMGAVWATCAAYTLALILSLIIGRKVFRLPFPASDFLRILISTLVMAVGLLAVPRRDGDLNTLGTLFVLSVGLYTLMIWLTNVGRVRRHLTYSRNWLVLLFKQKLR